MSSRTPRSLDQFYTTPVVARQCLRHLTTWMREEGLVARLWVEPSAGDGVFLTRCPSPRIGMDLDPRHAEILEHDFLTWAPPALDAKRTTPLQARAIIVVGNPPFGKNASLAKRFFHHASAWADVIAFIVPRTFQKESTHRQLPLTWECVREWVLPLASFRFQGKPYGVPCVFQIWRRSSSPRVMRRPRLIHSDFTFVDGPGRGVRAFQRVGMHAGRLHSRAATRSGSSHYFLKARDKTVWEVLLAIDWSDIKARTAGNPSISKSELIDAYVHATSSGA